MYYMVSDEEKTWTDHEANAAACGGHLASITSAYENDLITGIQSFESTKLWLGANQHFTDCPDTEPFGCWEWSDATTYSYTNYGSGLDNKNNDEHCLFLQTNAQRTWADRNCSKISKAVYIFVAGSPSDVNTCAYCDNSSMFLDGICVEMEFLTQSPSTSGSPTGRPTKSQTIILTKEPTVSPTKIPTTSPTKSLTEEPSKSPIKISTKNPTRSPTKSPTISPTISPTVSCSVANLC